MTGQKWADAAANSTRQKLSAKQQKGSAAESSRAAARARREKIKEK